MANEKKIIELYAKEEQQINAAIDKIVVELFNKWGKESSGQTIVMTGCSPVVGTTSTSIELGIAISTSKRKTLLVDCDVRKAIKYKKLNEEASLGLANYLLDDTIKLEDVIYHTNIENLQYIPCGDYSENPTRVLCSLRVGELIAEVKDKYDCILFDIPAVTIVPDAQVLFPNVDGIILLAALGETRKKQIKDAKRKVSPFAEKYYGMIVNKIPMDVYRQNVKDHDYYFVNKKGEQAFYKYEGYKKYARKRKSYKAKGEERNNEK